jgi:hypothetical protein
MTKPRIALLLALGIMVLAAVPLLAAGSGPEERAPGTLPASSHPAQETGGSGSPSAPGGLDFGGLSPQQIQTVTQILGENRCNCGCGMTLLECRTKDPNCSRSLALGRQVVQEVREGKDRATVVGNLQAALAKLASPPPAASPPPPAADVAYPIDTAGSPYKGAKGALVTIVEFSDFQ